MPFKISEKRMLPGIVLFVASLALFFTAPITHAPVSISEAGILKVLAALVLLLCSIRLLRRSVQHV